MIEDLKIDYTDQKRVRKAYKKDWVTSVEASRSMGLNTKKLRKLCKDSETFHALKVNISGTIKYWFDRHTIQYMEVEINK